MTETSTPSSPVGLLLGVFACAGSVGLYSILRTVSFIFFPDPNPANVIWSAHAGYFWRVLTDGYAMALFALILYFAMGTRPKAVVRLLMPTVLVAALLVAVQTAFIP